MYFRRPCSWLAVAWACLAGSCTALGGRNARWKPVGVPVVQPTLGKPDHSFPEVCFRSCLFSRNCFFNRFSRWSACVGAGGEVVRTWTLARVRRSIYLRAPTAPLLTCVRFVRVDFSFLRDIPSQVMPVQVSSFLPAKTNPYRWISRRHFSSVARGLHP